MRKNASMVRIGSVRLEKTAVIADVLTFRALLLFLFLIIASLFAMVQPAEAGNITYYLENNAINQSVGADGITQYYSTANTVVPRPYMNLLKNGTMGTQTNLRNATTSTTIEYEIFRFYLPSNYSVASLHVLMNRNAIC